MSKNGRHKKRTAETYDSAHGLHEKTMSIGDVAHEAGVCPKTAAGWFDKGRLPGYRLPSNGRGAGDRRVYRKDYLHFAASVGIRMSLDRPLMLAGVGERLASEFPSAICCSSLMELARLVTETPPRTVVLQYSSGEMAEAGRRLREWLPATKLIALLPDDCPLVLDPWASAGFNHVLQSPYAGLAKLLEG